MISQKESNAICDTMYSIRDAINNDDAIRALSLANDLYFDLLKIMVDNSTITCNINCKEGKE